MYRLLLLIFTCIPAYYCTEYRQEQAKIKYFNPKYIGDAQAFTGRLRRGDPYRTNLTVVVNQPFGNNVTIEVSYELRMTPPPISISIKCCDFIRVKWMVDFVKKIYPFDGVCPFPAMTYRIVNIELPPKNFPLPIPTGTHRINILYYHTDTKEPILHITGKMHVK